MDSPPEHGEETSMTRDLLGSRFHATRIPAWQNNGLKITNPISTREAFVRAGLDHPYAESPIGYALPDGTFRDRGEKKVILRGPTHTDPTWAELGVVSNEYQFLQNDELARGIDTLIDRTGWKLDSVGSLNEGQTIFAAIKVADRDVLGDKYHVNLIVTDGKAANRALQVSLIPMRLICVNGLMAPDAKNSVLISVPHTEGILDDYSFWLDHLESFATAQEKTFADLEQMATVKIDRDGVQEIAEAAFPLPELNAKARQYEVVAGLENITDDERAAMLTRLESGVKSHEYFTTYYQKRQDTVHELYERFNAGEEEGLRRGHRLSRRALNQLKETPYAAVQAVAELVDFGGQGNVVQSSASAMFGQGAGAKRRSWTRALELAA